MWRLFLSEVLRRNGRNGQGYGNAGCKATTENPGEQSVRGHSVAPAVHSGHGPPPMNDVPSPARSTDRRVEQLSLDQSGLCRAVLGTLLD
jgi:hypothetical protein